MKLPVPAFLDKIGKKEKQNYFLALLLRDEKAVAIVLEEVQGQLKLIGRAEEPITKAVEDIPYEELLAILDKTISQAEETLPPQVQTEKTIFGVKETWVEDKKIKKEYLAKLKKVCDALSLTPIGFMVVSEAIAHLLQQEEGAPFSGILSEIGKKNVTLSLFRAGKLIESHHKEIDGSLPDVVDKLLFHFTTHVLPSRIILFNGGSESLGQDFIAHQWSHGLPFLHVPQIAVLPHEFDGKAMIIGVAEQLGFSVAGTLGDLKVQDLGTPTTREKTSHRTESDTSDESGDNEADTSPEDSDDTTDTSGTPPASAEHFGFVVGKDIAKEPPPSQDTKEASLHSELNDDMSHKAAGAEQTHTLHKSDHDNLRIPQDMDHTPKTGHSSLAEDEADEQKKKGSFFSALPLGGITALVTSLPSRLGSLTARSLPFVPGGTRLIMIVPLLLILLGGMAYLYFYQVKATITLAVQPQIVKENEAITLAAGQRNNFSNGTLAARTIAIAVEGEESIQATGKKEVGEKAKGTVTLFNSSESRRSIPKGTTITASNDREFVTEEDVTVASASGDIFSGIKSGTAKVNVVAKEIGQEYNMPSNTTFSVAGSTTLAGKNESAFSGGTKKSITVVAQKDVTTLSTKLPKKLEEQAKKQLASKVQNGEAVLGIFTDVAMEEESTNHDVGDEAKAVTMKATVTFTTLSYKQSDIAELAKSTLISTNAQDLTLSEKTLKTQLQDLEIESEDEVSTSLMMEGGLLPNIKKEEITEELKGKSFSEAQEYLAGLSQVKNAQITLSPNLPFLPKYLPRKADNIVVEVVSGE